jgi:hypothetical protein
MVSALAILAARHFVKRERQQSGDEPRMAGLRAVQILVPDTRHPGFAEECRRQCRLVAQVEEADTDMDRFMDAALADLQGWRR